MCTNYKIVHIIHSALGATTYRCTAIVAEPRLMHSLYTKDNNSPIRFSELLHHCMCSMCSRGYLDTAWIPTCESINPNSHKTCMLHVRKCLHVESLPFMHRLIVLCLETVPWVFPFMKVGYIRKCSILLRRSQGCL